MSSLVLTLFLLAWIELTHVTGSHIQGFVVRMESGVLFSLMVLLHISLMFSRARASDWKFQEQLKQ